MIFIIKDVSIIWLQQLIQIPYVRLPKNSYFKKAFFLKSRNIFSLNQCSCIESFVQDLLNRNTYYFFVVCYCFLCKQSIIKSNTTNIPAIKRNSNSIFYFNRTFLHVGTNIQNTRMLGLSCCKSRLHLATFRCRNATSEFDTRWYQRPRLKNGNPERLFPDQCCNTVSFE